MDVTRVKVTFCAGMCAITSIIMIFALFRNLGIISFTIVRLR